MIGVALKHKWQLLVLLSFCLAHSLFCMRDYIDASYTGRGKNVFIHGWPVVYLQRIVPEAATGQRWKLYDGVFEFDGTALLLNIIAAIISSSMLATAWAWHCRSSKWWQISLRELLLFVAVLAVFLSVLAITRQTNADAQSFAALIRKDGWSVFEDDQPLAWYHQPFCDIGLLNKEECLFLQIEWRRGRSAQGAYEINDLLAQYADEHTSIHKVRSVLIEDAELSDCSVRQLCKLFPSCNRLDLEAGPGITSNTFDEIGQSMSRIKEMGIANVPLGSRSLSAIGSITSLERLFIGEGCGFPPTEWHLHFVVSRHLHRLGVPPDWCSNSISCDELRGHGVDVEVSW